MTFAALTPYLLFAAGYIVRHLDLLAKLAGLLGGSSSPATPSANKPALSFLPAPLAAHPILSDAVNAAIKQAVGDAVAGHVQSLRAELQAAAAAAAHAALADLKAKT